MPRVMSRMRIPGRPLKKLPCVLCVQHFFYIKNHDRIVLFFIPRIMGRVRIPGPPCICIERFAFFFFLGQNVTICHVEPRLPALLRRERLVLNHIFCACERCNDPSEFGTMYNAVKCIRKYLIITITLILHTWVIHLKTEVSKNI